MAHPARQPAPEWGQVSAGTLPCSDALPSGSRVAPPGRGVGWGRIASQHLLKPQPGCAPSDQSSNKNTSTPLALRLCPGEELQEGTTNPALFQKGKGSDGSFPWIWGQPGARI